MQKSTKYAKQYQKCKIERRYLEQFGKYWRSFQKSEKYQVKINYNIRYMDINNAVHIKVKKNSHTAFERP